MIYTIYSNLIQWHKLDGITFGRNTSYNGIWFVSCWCFGFLVNRTCSGPKSFMSVQHGGLIIVDLTDWTCLSLVNIPVPMLLHQLFCLICIHCCHSRKFFSATCHPRGSEQNPSFSIQLLRGQLGACRCARRTRGSAAIGGVPCIRRTENLSPPSHRKLSVPFILHRMHRVFAELNYFILAVDRYAAIKLRDWTRSCYWFVRGSFLLFYRLFTSRSGLTFTVSSSPTQLLWSLSLSCYSRENCQLRFANGTTFTTARRRTSPKDKRCSGRRRWPKRW